MSFRSLKEAAAEVLNKTRAESPKMPMQKLQDVRGAQPAGEGEVDLGGATWENPEGTAVGKITADHRATATAPGHGGQPGDKEGQAGEDRNIEDAHPGQPGCDKDGEQVSPEELNGKKKATGGKMAGEVDYAHATEEVELTAEEIAEALAAKKTAIADKMKAVSCKEDIDAILSGEKFSDEFKTKLTTIFEAAVIARAVVVVEEMEQDILAAAEESVEEIKTELSEQIDSYLTVMVEEWKEENKLAVEQGLKAELVEDFMSGLKKLFTENYIELPEEKVDVVESLSSQVAELTDKLNTAMNANVDLSKRVNEGKKQEIISKACEGLTATQAAKVKTLAEGVEFATEAEYAGKIKVIRESYVNAGKVTQETNIVALTESNGEPVVAEEPVKLDPAMAAYVAAITKTSV